MPRKAEAQGNRESVQERMNPQEMERTQSELKGWMDQATYGLASLAYNEKPILQINKKSIDITSYFDRNALQESIYKLHQKAAEEKWDGDKLGEKFEETIKYLFDSGEGLNERGKKIFGKDKTLEQKARGGWWPVSLGKKSKYQESDSDIDKALNQEGQAVYQLSQIVLSNPHYMQRHPELSQRLLKTADDLSVHYGALHMMEEQGLISGKEAGKLRSKMYQDLRENRSYAVRELKQNIMGERAAAAILGVLGVGALAVNASKVTSLGTAAVTGPVGNFAVTSIVGIGLLVAAMGLLISSFKKK